MQRTPSNGKGSRPRTVNTENWRNNFDAIDWSGKKRKNPSIDVTDFGGVCYDGSRSVIDPGGVVYDGSRGVNLRYKEELHKLPPPIEEEVTWDDSGSIIDEGGPVCDGASKFLDELRNKS